MQTYQSHKRVQAAQIESIQSIDDTPDYQVQLKGEEHGFTVSGKCFTRYFPEPGDYLVEYEDGYLSVSPKAAFEEGYAELEDTIKTAGPSPSDKAVEQMIQEKNLSAPRVHLEGMHDKIKGVEIVKHVSASGQVMRWAVLTMENGFAVTGKPSCAVSSANDDAELGEKIAVENAQEEVWSLEGYVLKQKIFEGTVTEAA